MRIRKKSLRIFFKESRKNSERKFLIKFKSCQEAWIFITKSLNKVYDLWWIRKWNMNLELIPDDPPPKKKCLIYHQSRRLKWIKQKLMNHCLGYFSGTIDHWWNIRCNLKLDATIYRRRITASNGVRTRLNTSASLPERCNHFSWKTWHNFPSNQQQIAVGNQTSCNYIGSKVSNTKLVPHLNQRQIHQSVHQLISSYDSKLALNEYRATINSNNMGVSTSNDDHSTANKPT